MSRDDRIPPHRNRFNRRGEVVPEHRRFMPYFGTDNYRDGWLIFAPRHSSPARLAFKAARAATRVGIAPK